MIEKLVISIAVIFVLMWLWVKFQDAGRKFAKDHPEFGRYREEGGECGKTCGCANWKHCVKKAEAGGRKSESGSQRTDVGAPEKSNPSTLSPIP